ncbi:MAG: hypothetical protein H6624_01205 [Bdellovibrionaceae bacterium]|nr:hypothetical protein [Pseudobdellovibrionaceae bacterium]
MESGAVVERVESTWVGGGTSLLVASGKPSWLSIGGVPYTGRHRAVLSLDPTIVENTSLLNHLNPTEDTGQLVFTAYGYRVENGKRNPFILTDILPVQHMYDGKDILYNISSVENELFYGKSVALHGRVKLMKFVKKLKEDPNLSYDGIVLFNDASAPYGNKLPPHEGHRNGLTVDMRTFGTRTPLYTSQCQPPKPPATTPNCATLFPTIAGLNAQSKIDAVGLYDDFRAYLTYKRSCLSASGCSTYPSAAVDRVVNWVVGNRRAFHRIAKLDAGATIKFSDGSHYWTALKSTVNTGSNSAQTPYVVINKLAISDAIKYGLWPDGSRILEDGVWIKTCGIGSIASDSAKIDNAFCSLDNVKFWKENFHYSHIDVEVRE